MAALVTKLDLYVLLQREDIQTVEKMCAFIISRIPTGLSEADSRKLLNFLKDFVYKYNRRWQDSHRQRKRFLEKNSLWLESNINWPVLQSINLTDIFSEPSDENMDPRTSVSVDIQTDVPCSSSVGTSTKVIPRKAFSELGNKQKKQRTSQLDQFSEEELYFAFISRLRSNGKFNLASEVKSLYEKASPLHSDNIKKIDGVQALAVYTGLQLSKWQYITLRNIFISYYDISILPSYYKLLMTKIQFYPDVTVSELSAQVNLQSLLDLTVKRIIDTPSTLLSDNKDLKLVCKWGFDGSSSHSNYKQKISLGMDDSSVFMTSLVPLRLQTEDIILWENPKPCSTMLCRPVKFEFVKETTDHIKSEQSKMENDIRNLLPSQYAGYSIHYDLHMTMIDGKVVTAVTNTPSSASCNVCLAKPSEMNDLEKIYKRTVRDDVYKYGLSTLHMWIRCMECLLHISYNIDFQSWAARDENKKLRKLKQEATQAEFREQSGLLIDIVKQGFGTTNDGNTARRFFKDYELTARITKIDVNLIKRFAVILQVISSGKLIKLEKFDAYCKETAKMYVELYPWYFMPASVHKLLIHGAVICKHFGNLPIGIMSEEASEARNKDFRHIREHHTRKASRTKANEDLLHNLLISSDPYLYYLRPKFSSSPKMNFIPETINLLKFEEEENEDEEEVACPLPSNQEATDPLV